MAERCNKTTNYFAGAYVICTHLKPCPIHGKRPISLEPPIFSSSPREASPPQETPPVPAPRLFDEAA